MSPRLVLGAGDDVACFGVKEVGVARPDGAGAGLRAQAAIELVTVELELGFVFLSARADRVDIHGRGLPVFKSLVYGSVRSEARANESRRAGPRTLRTGKTFKKLPSRARRWETF